MEILGRRWTGAIVRALLAGPSRFSEIVAAIPGLSDRLLSERLKELEAERITTRTVISRDAGARRVPSDPKGQGARGRSYSAVRVG
jgi:DNA-binding HxlR family transcriptional regulator